MHILEITKGLNSVNSNTTRFQAVQISDKIYETFMLTCVLTRTQKYMKPEKI